MIELVRKAREGNAEAFGELYEQYSKEMYLYAVSIVGNSAAAQDAVSDAVLEAFKSIKSLRDETSFKGWLFKILNASCRRQFNEFNKNLPLEDFYTVPDIDGVAEKDSALDLEKALEILSPDDRQIVIMKAVYGMSSEEMSEALSMPGSTVRSKLKRSLEKLRQYLGKEDSDDDR